MNGDVGRGGGGGGGEGWGGVCGSLVNRALWDVTV